MTPLRGSLGSYGRAGAAALELWADQAGVALTVHDASSDLRAAVRAAERDRPDLVFGPYGSSTTRAAAAATSRLLFNHGGAQVPAGNAIDVLAPADTYLAGAIAVVHRADPDAELVCILHGDTGFAIAVADGAASEAVRLGLRVDRRTLAAAAPTEARDNILVVVGDFAGELAVARRLLDRPWRAAIFVGAGTEEVLAPLGALREGLLGPCQWLASAALSPDEGPTAADFVAAYRHRVGAPPPYPAAQAFAAGVIAGRCLRDAGTTDDGAVLAAARRLDCTTLLGRFALDPATGHQVGHRVLTVQWQDGVRRCVWPPASAQAALRHPLCAARA